MVVRVERAFSLSKGPRPTSFFCHLERGPRQGGIPPVFGGMRCAARVERPAVGRESTQMKMQVPFGCAQGRLSTPRSPDPASRGRESRASASLRMTAQRFVPEGPLYPNCVLWW